VTLIAAAVATLVDAFLGIPLGFWLARTESRLQHAVTAGVLVPLAIPPVVGGLVIVLWLGPEGWLGGWLDRRGLGPLNTVAGTILAQMFVAAPFVILSARAAFAGVDRGQEDTARTLGCTPLQTLARVVLPAARRGLATGLVLGWVRCLGELGATEVVAYHPYTLPVLTYVRLSGEGLPTALPAGGVLAAVGGIAVGAHALARRPAAPSADRGARVALERNGRGFDPSLLDHRWVSLPPDAERSSAVGSNCNSFLEPSTSMPWSYFSRSFETNEPTTA